MRRACPIVQDMEKHYGYGNCNDVAANGRVIRAEAKGIAVTDLHQVRAMLISVTAEVRRKMTLKYKIEF